MATSPDKGFLEQLREMRNTRMQQLRQGGQQAGLLNKQIAAISTLNKTMESVLRAQSSSNATLKNLSTSQTNVSRQTEQMSKSINNLSSSITKSMGSVASAVGKGASGAVGAVGSAGGAVVGAASSVASGVASAVAKVLPFAIAGVVGKMMVWDKMDDSVKKDLTDSFGGLVKSIFGDIDTSGLKKVTAPITKEFGIVFGALGDTLEAITNKISMIIGKLPGSIDKVVESVDKVKNFVGPTIRKGKIAAEKIGDTVEGAIDLYGQGREAIQSLPPGTGTATAVAATAAGTVAAVQGTRKALTTPTAPPIAAATPSPAATSRPTTDNKPRAIQLARSRINSEATKEALKMLAEEGTKPTKANILTARMVYRMMKDLPAKAAVLLKVILKYKLAKYTFILTAVIELAGISFGYLEIEDMRREGILNDEEAEALKNLLYNLSAGSIIGSVVGGGLGAAAGGGVGSVPLGIAGSMAGNVVGSKIAELLTDLPESLTQEVEATPTNLYGSKSAGDIATTSGKLRSNKDPGGSGKRTGAITPPSASSSRNAFDMFKGAIGQAESGGDYGARNQSGSSASGKYQVIRSTFELYAKDKNSPVYGMTFEQFQKSSPDVQEALMDYMLQDYNRVLSAGGVPIDEKTLYLAHFLGPDTAVKVYNSDPKDSLSKYITKDGHYDLMVKQNPGLITPGTTTGEIQLAIGKRASSQMAGNRPATGSNTVAQASMTNQSSSYSENVARRRQEAKDAEMYEEGSDSFVGPVPPKPEKKKPLSEFAKQFSFESFSKGFKERTSELENVISSMATVKDITQSTNEIEKERTKSMQGINIIDQSTNVSSSSGGGGGGGGITVTPVTSYHASNMNWQFNSMSGGVRA